MPVKIFNIILSQWKVFKVLSWDYWINEIHIFKKSRWLIYGEWIGEEVKEWKQIHWLKGNYSLYKKRWCFGLGSWLERCKKGEDVAYVLQVETTEFTDGFDMDCESQWFLDFCFCFITFCFVFWLSNWM